MGLSRHGDNLPDGFRRPFGTVYDAPVMHLACFCKAVWSFFLPLCVPRAAWSIVTPQKTFECETFEKALECRNSTAQMTPQLHGKGCVLGCNLRGPMVPFAVAFQDPSRQLEAPGAEFSGLAKVFTLPATRGLCTDACTKTTFLLVTWPFCTSMFVGGRVG